MDADSLLAKPLMRILPGDDGDREEDYNSEPDDRDLPFWWPYEPW